MSVRDEVIGNSKRGLVLKTAGSIRVLVGDKYYNLDFRNEESKEDEDDNDSVESNFIISDSIDDYISGKLSYPGDNKIIFTFNGSIYYTKNNSYKKYVVNSGCDNNVIKEYNDTVNFNAYIPFSVNSDRLITNLNAEYLDGKRVSDFIQNNNNINLKSVTFNNIKSSDGKFSYDNGILKMPNTSYIYKELTEDYILDSNSNYVIKSNGFKTSIPNNYKNGDVINIYTLDDSKVEFNNNLIELASTIYYKFRCIPINNELKWVYTKDEYFI